MNWKWWLGLVVWDLLLIAAKIVVMGTGALSAGIVGFAAGVTWAVWLAPILRIGLKRQ